MTQLWREPAQQRSRIRVELMTPAEVAAVREQPERSSWLPARCYTDPAFYELDKERVFRRSWLGVGRVEAR